MILLKYYQLDHSQNSNLVSSQTIFVNHHSVEALWIQDHPNRQIVHCTLADFISTFYLSYQNSQLFDTTFQQRREPSCSVTNRYSGYVEETAMDVTGEPVSSKSKT